MFKLQIYVSVDYGIWPRFCLPAPPPRPGASRASVYVGGWISVTVKEPHLILWQMSTYLTVRWA